ncbi:hypothetical protein D3C79_964410 [compost metagenome]
MRSVEKPQHMATAKALPKIPRSVRRGYLCRAWPAALNGLRRYFRSWLRTLNVTTPQIVNSSPSRMYLGG